MVIHSDNITICPCITNREWVNVFPVYLLLLPVYLLQSLPKLFNRCMLTPCLLTEKTLETYSFICCFHIIPICKYFFDNQFVFLQYLKFGEGKYVFGLCSLCSVGIWIHDSGIHVYIFIWIYLEIVKCWHSLSYNYLFILLFSRCFESWSHLTKNPSLTLCVSVSSLAFLVRKSSGKLRHNSILHFQCWTTPAKTLWI